MSSLSELLERESELASKGEFKIKEGLQVECGQLKIRT